MASLAELIMLILVVSVSAQGQRNPMDVLQLILAQFESTLELHLRNRWDYDNPLVMLLLRQHSCPMRVFLEENMPQAEMQQVSKEEAEQQELASSFQRYKLHIYEHVHHLQQQQHGQFPDSGGFYILLLEKSPLNEEEQLLQFMESLWQQHGHTRIYYVQQQIGHVLLYNPFLKQIVVVEDAQCYRRMYANLHGYPLRAYIFDSVYSTFIGDGITKQAISVSGPDAEAAEAVASQLNFTLNYIWPDDEFFGSRQPNGSFSGGVGRIHRRELDIIFAGFFIKDYLTTRLQFSSAVYMDDLCLFVKKAQRIPQSIVPLFAVRVDVWLCFLLVGFVCAFIWLCLRAINLGLQIECIAGEATSSLRAARLCIAWRIFVDTWVVWVRSNINRFPPYNSERIFLASLCLVSVIFGALLESSLATAYIRPLYYKDPNTLEELDKAQTPIYIKHPAFRDDLFVGSDSEVYQRLDARMKLVGEGEDRLINMVSRLGTFAGVTRAASLELNDRRYVMTHKVHKIPQCPKTYHIGYVLPRPSPYLEGMNIVLLRLLAGGIMDFWISQVKEQATLSIHKYPEYLAELNVGQWKVLTLSDVQLGFYALVIGCLLASLVALLELGLHARWHRHDAKLKRSTSTKATVLYSLNHSVYRNETPSGSLKRF